MDNFDFMSAAVMLGAMLRLRQKPHYETAPPPVNDVYNEETDSSLLGYWDEDGNFIEY